MIKRFHEFFLSLLAVFLLIFAGIWIFEHNRDAEDYTRYYAMIPLGTAFDYDAPLQYVAFLQSFSAVDTKWEDEVYCDNGNGFSYVDSEINYEKDYFLKTKYPDRIQDILDVYDHLAPNQKKSAEVILRKYAVAPKQINDRWTLDVSRPPNPSTCFAKHTITVYTPFLRLEKKQSLISPQWYYGDSGVSYPFTKIR